MKERDLNRALKLVVSDYRATFGDSAGSLSSFRFNFSIIDSNEEINAICIAAAPEPIQKKKYLKRIFDHFVAEGYAKADGSNYELTKLGYKKGSQGFPAQALEFLNKNPGILSLAALIVSLFALYVSYTNP